VSTRGGPTVRVTVSSVLFDYTGDRREVEACGATLGALLLDLDRRYPGLRFRVVDEQERVRPHMNVFVAGQRAQGLATRIAEGDEVHLLQALSGG